MTSKAILWGLLLGIGLPIYYSVLPTLYILAYPKPHAQQRKKIVFWFLVIENLLLSMVIALFWENSGDQPLSQEEKKAFVPVFMFFFLVPFIFWTMIWPAVVVQGKPLKKALKFWKE